MKNYTIEELQVEFKKLNYAWFDFQIIGVRNKNNVSNKFIDTMYIVSNNKLYQFSCTTRPGLYWLKNFLNKKGTAVLKCGQYIKSFKLGLHQGKYLALVQAKPLPVYRDNNKNEFAEEIGSLDIGFFGINIHKASNFLKSILIDKWSAGCQVLNNPDEFEYFMNLCIESEQSYFTYTLLKEF